MPCTEITEYLVLVLVLQVNDALFMVKLTYRVCATLIRVLVLNYNSQVQGISSFFFSYVRKVEHNSGF